jgi:hypothetical protein
MTAAQRLAKILTDPPVGSIDFTFGKIHVSSIELSKVAKQLLSGSLSVIDRTPQNGTNAEYDPHSKEFHVHGITDGDYSQTHTRALLVHESVHAVIQLNSWECTRLSGEVVGYVSQVLYGLLRDGEEYSRSARERTKTDSKRGAILEKCLTIIKRLNLQSACGVLSLKDGSELITLIHAHPSYHKFQIDEKTPK